MTDHKEPQGTEINNCTGDKHQTNIQNSIAGANIPGKAEEKPPAWAPELGWYGEKKAFNVVLMAIYSVENAGIRYLSAALRRAGFTVTCIFLRDWVNNKLEVPSPEDIRLALELIKKCRADLIGLGFMSSLYSMAQIITTHCKQAFPTTPVIWGGIHVTSVPEECFGDMDYLCLGEGEAALIDLCQRLYLKQQTTDIPNIWAFRNGQTYKNELRPLIADLDQLPYPDTDSHNKFYIEHGRVSQEEPWKRTAEYRIYFSRGCPYSCSYCYVSILRQKYESMQLTPTPQVDLPAAADHSNAAALPQAKPQDKPQDKPAKQHFYRYRSVEHVLGELEHVRRTFPRLARVKVDDDTSFAFPQSWIDEFCAKYPSRIGVPFECLLIPPMLREELLSKLKGAGLRRVQTGIESGSSKESREIHNRTPGNAAILRFGELNRKLKLSVVYDVIIDNPSATEEMKIETAEFLLELPRPYDIYFYSLNNFPGTVLTKRLLAEGKLDPSQVEGRSTKAWKQFRVSMDWPRSAEDKFYLALYCLASKPFVPKALIRHLLQERTFWKQHYRPLFLLAKVTNIIKMFFVALRYLKDGELTWFKLRQYGDLRKLISQ